MEKEARPTVTSNPFDRPSTPKRRTVKLFGVGAGMDVGSLG